MQRPIQVLETFVFPEVSIEEVIAVGESEIDPKDGEANLIESFKHSFSLRERTIHVTEEEVDSYG